MRLVAILSPFQGNERRNRDYARRALLDSVKRGEAPFAAHLLYPQILSEKTKDRETGMVCGRAWIEVVDAVVVYGDLGMSGGMLEDLNAAREASISCEMRMLGKPKGRPKKKRTKKSDEPKSEAAPKTEPVKDGAPGKRRTRKQLSDDALKAILGSKGLTKKALRDELHCSGATLGRVLDDLVEADLVSVSGKERKARYRAKAQGGFAGVQGAVDDVVGK